MEQIPNWARRIYISKGEIPFAYYVIEEDWCSLDTDTYDCIKSQLVGEYLE